MIYRSNNTNKLSPQELVAVAEKKDLVQIIQINLVLKNSNIILGKPFTVQIIQINLVLKNFVLWEQENIFVQIIQINLVLKNGLNIKQMVQAFK